MEIQELLDLAKVTAPSEPQPEFEFTPKLKELTVQDWTNIDRETPIRVEGERIGRQADIIKYSRDAPYYAIKRYTEIDRATFVRETKILALIAQCPHPFLLHEHYYNESKRCIVTHWYHRGTLTDWIVNPDLDSDDIAAKLTILIGVASALDHLHTVCEITHEDIKTDNILVSRFIVSDTDKLLIIVKIDDNNHPLIIDYGLSVTMKNWICPRVQDPGHGTGPYMAPEVFRIPTMLQYDDWRRVDIYALGIVIFCMAATRVV